VDDRVRRVTEKVRALPEEIVHVVATVDIEQPGALGGADERVRTTEADVGVHAARSSFECAQPQLIRTGRQLTLFV
jgi:hypothetical protein